AIDEVEGVLGRQIGATPFESHDEFNLEMQVFGEGRIGHGRPIPHHRISGFGEEKWRSALVLPHFTNVLDIVAAHAPDPPYGESAAGSCNRKCGTGWRGYDIVLVDRHE